jgi:hypothetical protein
MNWAALAKPKVPVSGGAYTEASVGPAVHSIGGGGNKDASESSTCHPPRRGDAQLGKPSDNPTGKSLDQMPRLFFLDGGKGKAPAFYPCGICRIA